MYQRGEGLVGESGSDNSAKSCNLAWYYTQLPPSPPTLSLSLGLQSHIQHSQIILCDMKEHRSLLSCCQTEARLSEAPSFSFAALRAEAEAHGAGWGWRRNKGAAKVTLGMWDLTAVFGVNIHVG